MKKDIYIFGAHSRGRTLARYLTSLDKDVCVKAYIYDNDELNPDSIDGVPVLHMSKCLKRLNGATVYIGTRGIHYKHIVAVLHECGVCTILPCTPEMDMKLRHEYIERVFKERHAEFQLLENLSSKKKDNTFDAEEVEGHVYTVKSAYDVCLSKEVKLRKYERFIYVGCDLDIGRQLCEGYMDNIGENISDRNKQFCELTALYWAWKNSNDEYIGIQHYRRRFILGDDWVRKLMKNDIEVVLPIPLSVLPSVAENFCERHDSQIWITALRTLRKMHPDDYQMACEYFDDELYSPCNMLIMHRKVLDEYCSWLFPMLFEIVKTEGEKEDHYLNRYPGFIAERFLSFWCSKYVESKRLVYADKVFLT